jgi:aminoglycoside 6'-N-acetyltransferase
MRVQPHGQHPDQSDGMPIREVSLEKFDPELHSQALAEWLYQPHVSRWWGNPQRAMEDARLRSPDTSALIVADGTHVGYLCWQTPTRDERELAGLIDLPEGLVDIDVLIGESDLIDRGVGSRALGLLLDRLRADPQVSVAGVGTSVSNKRAIRAFQKAGFRLYREFEDPEFGSCWYMIVEVRDPI